MEQRRRLGRGLSSLIGPAAPVRVEIPNKYQSFEPATDVEGAYGVEGGVGGAGATPAAVQETPGIAPIGGGEVSGGEARGGEVTGEGVGSGGGDLVGGGERVWMLEVGEVEPSRFQPRQTFDEVKLRELAESIRSIGVMQPVVVRRIEREPEAGGGGASYELIAGERRWRAAQLAGVVRVPAIVREITDEESAAWGLIENVQREDLDAMEKAWACRGMVERFGLSASDLAEKLGMERSTVANLVRLTELEEPIQKWVRVGKLNAGHAKALLAAPAGGVRLAAAHLAADLGWSVRRLEQEIKKVLDGQKAAGQGAPSKSEERMRSASLVDLEKRIGEHLGTRVSVRPDRSGKRGKIEIAFFDLDHFDGLMQKIGFGGQ